MGDETKPYSWSDRYPYGYGRTPRERLISDMARLLHLHGVDGGLDADALVLAKFLAGCLDVHRTTVGKERKGS